MTLTIGDISDRHPFLAQQYPDRKPVRDVLVPGHPWPCPSCDVDSLLCYRCSACGKDLTGDT